MATSTALMKRELEIMVKISNNVVDIKKCAKIAYESNFRFKNMVKYRGEFYFTFVGSDSEPFPAEYESISLSQIDKKEFDSTMKLKRAAYIGDDNFTGFAMTEQTFDVYIRSIAGSAGLVEPEEIEPCKCCQAYVWKVEVPNDREAIKKLLKTALCHTSNNCLPIAVYYKDNKHYIMFKSNGTDPIECVKREGFTEVTFSGRESDGERMTLRNFAKFTMKHIEFWDYVDDLLRDYKKIFERDGKDTCE
jgi:hypothetical protein